MNSPFRYPGGKSKTNVAEWILSFKPEVVGQYREPFVGGGGIFWRMTGRRWINDMHPGLMAVYEAFRDRPEAFLLKCRAITPARPNEAKTASGRAGGTPKTTRLLKVFNQMKSDSRFDPAFRYFFLNRTNFGGRVDYTRPNRFFMSNERGWDIVNKTQMEDAVRHMQGVRTTCGSYAPLLSKPGKNVWVYVDPPYVVNDTLGGDQLYEHNFTEKDHRILAERVAASPHRVAISYDDHPLIRELYQGFRIVSKSWKYGGTTLAEKKDGKEILVMNY